jgi:hypothetical protein
MVTAKASTRIANFHFMILSLLYSDGTLTWRRNRPEQCLFLFSVTRTAQDVELAIGLRFSLAGHGKLPLSMRKMRRITRWEQEHLLEAAQQLLDASRDGRTSVRHDESPHEGDALPDQNAPKGSRRDGPLGSCL